MHGSSVPRLIASVATGMLALLALSAFGVRGVEAAPAGELACGNVVTESVKLTADVTGCTGDGLIVGADNITIDGDGHVLGSGISAFSGLVIDGRSNVRIKNLTIAPYGVGLLVSNSTRISVDNVTIDSTTAQLANISNSSQVSITDSHFLVSGGGGVTITNSNDIRLMRNEAISGADGGFYFVDVDGARVIHNVASGSYFASFGLIGTTDSTFIGNSSGNTSLAPNFYVDGDSTGNRIIHNSSQSETEGSFVDESSGDGTAGTANTYQGNTCTDASDPEGLCDVQSP
jgi:parallel beta-helix repeat protein